VGAWIETRFEIYVASLGRSRPAWARGLKQVSKSAAKKIMGVAPCVGAWIETGVVPGTSGSFRCRALRGRVD